jgi:hypothetical protein
MGLSALLASAALALLAAFTLRRARPAEIAVGIDVAVLPS